MKHAGETTSDEAQALLQNRVASFALSFGAIMLVAVIGRTIAVLRYPEELAFVPAGTLGFQAAATGCLLVIYLLTRGRPRSAGFVRVVEVFESGGRVVRSAVRWLGAGGAVRGAASPDPH